MPWNWELPGWPNWSHHTLSDLKNQFLLKAGSEFAYLKMLDHEERTLV